MAPVEGVHPGPASVSAGARAPWARGELTLGLGGLQAVGRDDARSVPGSPPRRSATPSTSGPERLYSSLSPSTPDD